MSIHNTVVGEQTGVSHYDKIIKKKGVLTLILFLLLLGLICISLSLGAARIGLGELMTILFGIKGSASAAQAHIILKHQAAARDTGHYRRHGPGRFRNGYAGCS